MKTTISKAQALRAVEVIKRWRGNGQDGLVQAIDSLVGYGGTVRAVYNWFCDCNHHSLESAFRAYIGEWAFPRSNFGERYRNEPDRGDFPEEQELDRIRRFRDFLTDYIEAHDANGVPE